MNSITSYALSAAFLLATACGDSPTDPSLRPPESALGSPIRPNTISVMSRNLYIGFDADAAIAALSTGNPAIFVPVLEASIATLQGTDFTARAQAFAAEIARTRPAAVGLQEVWRINADLSGLGVPMVIDLDYLQILRQALADRDLPYVLVASVEDMNAQPLPGISFVDREALLVDASRVRVTGDVVAKTFNDNISDWIGPLAPGVYKRTGFVLAPVTIEGMPVTFVTTHLESDLGPDLHDLVAGLRAQQAGEIAIAVGSAPMAVIVGDMNDVEGSLMYGVFTGAGLTDTWKALQAQDPGLTGSCFPADLQAPAGECQERIDFVFARGLEHPRAGMLGRDFLVGLSPSERVQGPAGLIWPSDHAGVVGEFRIPPAVGLRP